VIARNDEESIKSAAWYRSGTLHYIILLVSCPLSLQGLAVTRTFQQHPAGIRERNLSASSKTFPLPDMAGDGCLL
jgi:hypothetical protein